MRVAILGPVSPGPLAAHLYPHFREAAESHVRSYGPAPTALADGLLGEGHEVVVITHCKGEGSLSLDGPRLQFRQVGSRRSSRDQALDSWAAERSLMGAELKLQEPDLVHAHWTYEWALTALESGKPTLITVRDAPLTVLRYHRDAYRFLRTLLAYRVRVMGRRTLMAGVSPYMAAAWRRQMAWRREMPILPNMVPSDVRSQCVGKSPVPIIVEVADSGRRKNVRTLIRAFRRVRDFVPDAKLELVGFGLGAGGAIAQWAYSKGLAEGVEFLGVLDRAEVIWRIERAWVHAHASLEESFGNTLVEAMALGTAVVGGNRSAAVPWVLSAGKAGRLANVDSEVEFADAIVEVLINSEQRQMYEVAGMTRVETVFSAKAVLAAHVSTYQAVIEGVAL